MTNQAPQEPRFEKGLPVPVVITGGLIVFAIFVVLLYLLVAQLTNSEAGSALSASLQKIKESVAEKVSELDKSDQAPLVKQEKETEQPKKSPQRTLQTYDIGAYITYGGLAFTLSRAAAKLSADRKRLAVGLYESTQVSNEKPALALIFSFKKAANICSADNVAEFAQLFNLRAMGGVPAQQVQVIQTDPEELSYSLENFTCDLKPGGRLKIQLLGSDPNLLKPKDTTFGWGVRLEQEIG